MAFGKQLLHFLKKAQSGNKWHREGLCVSNESGQLSNGNRYVNNKLNFGIVFACNSYAPVYQEIAPIF